MRSGVRIIQSFNPTFRNKPHTSKIPRAQLSWLLFPHWLCYELFSVQAASGRERALQSGAARPPPLRLGLIREGAKRLEGRESLREVRAERGLRNSERGGSRAEGKAEPQRRSGALYQGETWGASRGRA
jgi:hypothetical protein